MRKYEISITTTDGKTLFKKKFGKDSGSYDFKGVWSSTLDSGNVNNPGALNIEFDIPVSVYNVPIGNASIRIYGIGLPMIWEATDFNPSIDFSKYFNIKVKVGMNKGLPLAKKDQYGEITNSRILQAYGNWQGTSQSLDFVMGLPVGNKAQPLNLQFKCPRDAFIKEYIETSLATAFSGIVSKENIKVDINPKLVVPEDRIQAANTLTEFAKYLNELSKSIIKDVNYPGIQISYQNGYIEVYDYTNAEDRKSHQIEFTDLIGQPTWIGTQTVSIKTVMRGDLKVGDIILMPKQSQERNLILSAPGTYAQYRNKSAFTDKFWITSLRHTGIFRQASADSWVTTIQAVSLLPLQST